MKLFLHIGNHKTGSTTIQNSMKKESELLLSKYGILYPETFQVRGAHHLFASTILNEKMLFGEEIVDTTDELMTELKREIQLKKPKSIFLSSEEFFRFHEKDIVNLETFMDIFDEIEIVVYLRNQFDHIESSYKFNVLWEFVQLQQSFGEYLERQLSSDYHCYDQRLLEWKKIFSRARITLRDFNEEIKQGLLLNFYRSVLNIDFPVKDNKDNESLSRLSSIILKLKNSPKWSSADRKACIESLKKFDQKSNINKKQKLYSSVEYSQVIEKFYNSNEILKNSFGIDLNANMMNVPHGLLAGESIKKDDVSLILSNQNEIICIEGNESWLQM